jgi:hypothetical protein
MMRKAILHTNHKGTCYNSIMENYQNKLISIKRYLGSCYMDMDKEKWT